MLTQAVAFEITPPRGRVIRCASPIAARRFWAKYADQEGARLRVIADTGEEFGTKTYYDEHGVTCFTERCWDCEREFLTPRVGEQLCPGCELLATGGVTLDAKQ